MKMSLLTIELARGPTLQLIHAHGNKPHRQEVLFSLPSQTFSTVVRVARELYHSETKSKN